MGVGIILLFFAIILWSYFHRFSSAIIAVTALFVYASVALDLLEFYSVVDVDNLLTYKDIPLVRYILVFLTLISFIVTLIVFYREEKKTVG
jgi:hypothetical protein